MGSAGTLGMGSSLGGSGDPELRRPLTEPCVPAAPGAAPPAAVAMAGSEPLAGGARRPRCQL